jgi:type IX secretion system PorP/SprF family membrane protein
MIHLPPILRNFLLYKLSLKMIFSLVIYLFLTLILFFNTSLAQQTPNFSQFFLQDYSYNPSLIGPDDNSSDVSVIHRQWSADFLETGPNTTNIGFDRRFKKQKWGFALQYVNDNQGQAFSSNNFRGGLSFSPNPESSLPISFGLGLNYLNTQFNPSDFENMEPGDQLLNAGQLTNQFLTPSFGLNFKIQKKESFLLQLGFASTNLLDILNTQSKNPIDWLFDQYNGFLKMRIGEEDEFNFNLISLYRANGGLSTDNYVGWSNNLLPRNLNIVALFNSGKRLSIGPSLNTYFVGDNSTNLSSAGGIISIKEFIPNSGNKKFNFGIAYDFNISNLQQYSKGTFEISLSASFGGGKNYSEDKREYKEAMIEYKEAMIEVINNAVEESIGEKPNKKEKRKKPKPNPFLKPKQKLNALLAEFDIEIYYIDGGFKKINFTGDENGNFNVSIPDPDGFLDIKGNHITGDHFKMKITPPNSKSNHFYTVSFSDKDNSQIKGEVKISNKKPFSYFFPIKISLPKNLEVDDYYLLIRCYNDNDESDYIKIPIFIQDYD